MNALARLYANDISVDLKALAVIARRSAVNEIAVFGSSIREDMREDRDIDLLVTFTPGAPVSLFDVMDLEQELAALLGRDVDVVEPDSLTNPVRRHEILSSKASLCAA